MNKEEFQKIALEMGGKVIKITPSKKDSLNIFENIGYAIPYSLA